MEKQKMENINTISEPVSLFPDVEKASPRQFVGAVNNQNRFSPPSLKSRQTSSKKKLQFRFFRKKKNNSCRR